MEAMPGFEPGIKALQASALPLGYIAVPVRRERRLSKTRAGSVGPEPVGPGHRRVIYGADDRIRTGDPNLGKVVLYQLSHVRTRQSARGRIAKRPRPRKQHFAAVVVAFRGLARAVKGRYNTQRCACRRHGRLAQGESTSLTRKGS